MARSVPMAAQDPIRVQIPGRRGANRRYGAKVSAEHVQRELGRDVCFE